MNQEHLNRLDFTNEALTKWLDDCPFDIWHFNQNWDKKEYSKALKNIMVIADKINAYVSNQEPWNKAKNGEEDKCIEICSEALNVFKDLTILLQPFIPSVAEKIFKLLNTKTLNYDDLSKDNLNKIQKFQPFITRLEKNDFDGILD